MDTDESTARSKRPRQTRNDDREGDRVDRRSRRNSAERDERRHRDRNTSNDRDRRRRDRSRSPRSAEPRRRSSRSRDRDRRDRHGDRESRRNRSQTRDHKDRRENYQSRRKEHNSDEDKNQDKQVVRRSGPLPSQAASFALTSGEEPPIEKEKPNFGNTGALAAASNAVAQSDGSAIVLKYHEPPEARKPSPKDVWKLFVFKGQDIIDTIELNHRTCWLIGRERSVIDILAEHPSISKQHAVIQFRYIEKRNEYGDKIGKVKPYLIDLESANGTMLNSKKAPQSRYLELIDKDLIQFGQSTREYVLMLAPKD